MSKIHVLEPAIANKIAAGEVVERPGSVVKELVENSMDAGSARIDVEIEEGGKNLIRVTDDGVGMDIGDLPLAFASHATSKLEKPEDLFAISTLGFRGEALASIGSVSQARIVSRPRGQETGAEIECRGGEIGEPRVCGASPGTLVEVRHLFTNVPVRRKFLKSTASETAAITEMMTRMALAFPGVHFRFLSNGKEVFHCPPSDRLERVRHFYGKELADSLLLLESRSPELHLEGYASLPALHRANRAWQLLFLNGRFIQDRSISHAMNEAYRGLLPEGRFPVLFLFLEMDPAEVDVNAHPTKIEVRFRNTWSLYGRVLSAVRHRLLSEEKVAALRVDPQPALFLDTVGGGATEGRSNPSTLAFPPPGVARPTTAAPPDAPPADGTGSARPAGPADAAAASDRPPASGGPTSRRDFPSDRPPRGREAAQAGPEPPSPPQDWDPSAGPFLQIHNSYIVVQSPEGFVVIDQHALHERILYSELLEKVRAKRMDTQPLLLPEPVELTPKELALARELTATLRELGLEIEEFGPRSVLIQSVPSFLESARAAHVLHDLFSELSEGERPRSLEKLRERILATMACKGAIKFGQALKPDEIASLLQRSRQIPESIACAHGRPTRLAVNLKELDRQFGRK
ncbi:MAG: DNA mismatch repair endonuclease MutL [Planctomycetes bacterium]|nr:DNA mismatch repair endonuclease MutL [Planctomycetota bacterium]